MAWGISRGTINRKVIGLLAIAGLCLAFWLLWRWLLFALVIAVPCVAVLLWVSRQRSKKREWRGRIDGKRR